LIKFFLKIIRLSILQNQREIKLSLIFSHLIKKYKTSNSLRVLDFGSGFEPKIASYIKSTLEKEIKIEITCMDLYKKKDLDILNKKYNLKFYNISSLNNFNKKFHFCIISDVFHHIGIDKTKKILLILNKIRKISDIIIIKDHFEYDFFSRQTLRFMDFIGNYYNSVNIPKKYFTKTIFNKLIKKANFKIISKILTIRYYSKIFLFFSNPKIHFIYTIK
jgi:hypothetical protein